MLMEMFNISKVDIPRRESEMIIVLCSGLAWLDKLIESSRW